MKHIAIKYSVNGGGYQIHRVSTEKTDQRVALVYDVLSELFLGDVPRSGLPKTFYGTHDGLKVMGFQKSAVLALLAENPSYHLVDEPQSVAFRALTEREKIHDDVVYEDGFLWLEQALGNRSEELESQGFVKAVVKGGKLTLFSDCAVEVRSVTGEAMPQPPSVTQPEPSYEYEEGFDG